MDTKLAAVFLLILLLIGATSCGANEATPTAAEEPADETAAGETEPDTVQPTEPPTDPEPTEPQAGETPPEEATPTEEPAAESTAEQEATETQEAPAFPGFLIDNDDIQTPESVLHDPQADVYLVSNINGSPGAADDNGFITRLSPQGEVLMLKWIDGAAEGVTLHAPKGTAVTGDELWVSDIITVRIFDRVSGEPLGDVPIDGASFLNDVAAAPDGAVWVSDSNTGKLYRIAPDHTVEEVATVDGINGVAFLGDGTPLVTSGSSILAVAADGSTSEHASVPAGSLDGLAVLRDGRVAVSSWATSTVYLLGPEGPVALESGLNSPADIGYDASRAYILVPLFRENRIRAVPIP